MKKLTILAASALLLAGCSGSSTTSGIDTKISDDKTVITIDGIEITKQNVFETLLSQYGPDQILNEALQAIADVEITDQSAVDERVQSTLASYESYFSEDNTFEDYVTTTLGYESVDDYANQVIRPSQLQQELLYKYIDDNFDDLVAEYGFVYVRYFTTETESDAMKAISAIDEGTMSFEDCAASYEATPTDTTLISTIYDGDAIDSNVASNACAFTTEAMYGVPIALSDGTYAVIQVVSKDLSNAADDIDSAFADNEDFVIDVECYYLKKYNFTVYESTLKDGIDEISEEYLSSDDGE